jgi:hypothetical protein
MERCSPGLKVSLGGAPARVRSSSGPRHDDLKAALEMIEQSSC